jgi:hypothetical protein
MSVTVSTSKIDATANPNNVCGYNPYLQNTATNKHPVINSIIGYCILIFSWQKPHLPFKMIYERIGMLCHHFSLFPQFGHFDGGRTIDSPLKALSITTFKKLPITVPNIKTKTNISVNKIANVIIFLLLFFHIILSCYVINF